jgi:1-acyl-sn-glycerol-3-phosphate acyltransferase
MSGSAPDPRRARIGRIVGSTLFHTVYRGRMRHASRVPQDGPVILVANHAAFLDGPIVFSLTPRPVNFLVKQEAFHGLFGRVLLAVGQIPIDRSVGDRTALSTAVAVLELGGAVGIFPEGTRGDGDVDEVNQGAAWIALRSGARVVPVAVHGSRMPGRSADAWPPPLRRITVDYGHPFEVAAPAGLPGRARLRAATDLVRDRLASHVRSSRVENGPSPTPTDSRTP